MKIIVIAEIGMNHDGSFGNACRLIDEAAECGVDAVKLQTHLAEAETLLNAPTPPYFRGEPRFEYFKRTSFTVEEWQRLNRHCQEKGVEFLSSPFSIEAVDLLEQVGVSRYKIPSGEVTNIPLLEKITRLNKPIILSSGMSSWEELDLAVETIRKYHDHLTILQCTSEYPCPSEHVGLNVMMEMQTRYGLKVGLSDHTMTNYAAYAAVTLGASVIEKHFTLSRKMYGSDAKHSLEPDELADLVRGIRAIEAMLANPVDKDDIGRFKVMKETFEKSLVTLVEIPKGVIITREMIGIKKPGRGIPPGRLGSVIGKMAARDISSDTMLSPNDLLEYEA